MHVCIQIYIYIYIYIRVIPKIGVPQNGWFIIENPVKWMIWGYPYFRKHPYIRYMYIYSYLHFRSPQYQLPVFESTKDRALPSWALDLVWRSLDVWRDMGLFWSTAAWAPWYCWWFRNPKQPPGMYKTLQIMGYLLYQLVQDFFHQPYWRVVSTTSKHL